MASYEAKLAMREVMNGARTIRGVQAAQKRAARAIREMRVGYSMTWTQISALTGSTVSELRAIYKSVYPYS